MIIRGMKIPLISYFFLFFSMSASEKIIPFHHLSDGTFRIQKDLLNGIEY